MVSVIVLNYNGAEDLPVCLDSLLAQSYRSVQVIVADNGSQDNSAELCAGFPGVKFLPLRKNYGFGMGNNLGAEEADGDYLFFVNNDMRFADDCIEMLVDVAQATPDLFALDIKQYTWDGARVAHAASGVCRPGLGRLRFIPGVASIQFEVEDTVAVPTANGANLFCVAERFHELGGFDPSFFLHWEDIDLCWRARLCGWEILYVPLAYCWHKIDASKQREIERESRFERTVWFSIERNRYRFVAKTMNARRNLSVFAECARMIARLLLSGRWGSARLLAAAYLDAIGKFWEVQAYKKRYGGAEDGARSEEIIQRFWVKDEQVSALESQGRIVRL